MYEANTPIEVRLSVVSARLMVGSPTLVLKPTGTRAPSSGCWGERMPSLPSHEMTATSVRQAIAHKLTAVSGKILFIVFWFFLFFSCSFLVRARAGTFNPVRAVYSSAVILKITFFLRYLL
ncbi:hypothetical protein PO027_10985 [Bacteroides thetaiotaomicron]|uniref:hypothetical protein n=1 Tax=Bacteroides thetaiotaomicron TaxID=818 RepID=UPI00232ABC94|nr:hypothetical protein [Bacteroides thetaiotaomicron]MDC2007303.1 hypothetical protein [Bacteroides thetaiotaomicron]MDC2021679.1 hypothetical protein [Bacteroides thetaiotaomicron]MDC2025182.1 hypothetical protein [Bacteroides thetaiotaomicron]MDC2030640.1 hypothetical protein [Bacteroides thetaiotaomicron]MDC2061507.1 hypothetical protein [Bacteroides thetaiotaomicron]